ncbi:MAG: hypothetical protein JGK17_19000 [Microcoleus sp. PH2017_10_PVI_O_A]|nr:MULTISPECIES: hypothetical protein [unclassified Microcoleus]MCC3407642.1 hypothetical protein [Microcoleus sp. PH2017_10_PVI_O_A]
MPQKTEEPPETGTVRRTIVVNAPKILGFCSGSGDSLGCKSIQKSKI